MAAGLDVDKEDLKRLSDFVRQKIYDLLLAAQATAEANGRDIIEVHDLPITNGLRESIRAFEALDTELELEPILEHLAELPPLRLGYSYEVEAELPRLVGALTVALARTSRFWIRKSKTRNPCTGSGLWRSSTCCCNHPAGS